MAWFIRKSLHCVIYSSRPGSEQLSGLFFKELISILENITVLSSRIILTGDFNVHVEKTNDSYAANFNDIFDNFQLINRVKAPTHLRGGTLDLIVTSEDFPCIVESNDGFQVVRSKKRKKSSTFPQPASPKPASKPASKQMKTYGTGISCPLKASKIIEEKITYYIGNVSTCNKNIIEDHLKQNNIAFLQCFPVLRKKNPDDPLVERRQTTEWTAFKIIIPLNEREKLVNPNIWPMHTFLREWDYNMSASKKKDGNFRPTTININHGGNN
ncbi:hypothetical protein HELRODRAFT_169388 [Helobdella robusta]|uniref:Endonuclease/exonuclease/phosphatase domain-containing protein n=1 Tax=Helobdella robusta TaxID=6412 RepID=T1F1V8_HELRO|nr:hypothetical protein HELRODRAFT_169388 [Helobdella robusta]ESO08527.1 hypothetical protein HELRODRAFT_169388 [Helobdella robusta]